MLEIFYDYSRKKCFSRGVHNFLFLSEMSCLHSRSSGTDEEQKTKKLKTRQ